eukprot:scaffold91465_cov37-Cyclotella_meneghiniana.AAC.3
MLSGLRAKRFYGGRRALSDVTRSTGHTDRALGLSNLAKVFGAMESEVQSDLGSFSTLSNRFRSATPSSFEKVDMDVDPRGADYGFSTSLKTDHDQSSTQPVKSIEEEVSPFESLPAGNRNAFTVVLLDDPSKFCLGKVGRDGKFCMSTSCNCESHKTKKASPVAGVYYLVNNKNHALPDTVFMPSEVEDDELWNQYKAEPLSTRGWNALLQMIRHNKAADAEDTYGVEDAVDLIESTIDKSGVVLPTTARKRRKVIPNSVPWSETDPVEIQVKEMSEFFCELLQSADESISELSTHSARLAVLLGTPSDSSDNFSSAFSSVEALTGRVASLQQLVTSAREEFQAFETASLRNEEELKVRIDGATIVAQEARTMAAKAQRIVSAIESTGIAGSFTDLTTRIRALDDKNRNISAEVDALFKVVESIADLPSSATASATAEEFAALKTDLYSKVEALKDSAGTGPIQMGRLKFDGVQSCMDALQKWGVTGLIIHHMMDTINLMALLRSPTTYREEFQQDTIIEMKTAKSSQMISVSASFESVVPELFAGAKAAAREVSHRSSMAGVNTYQKWDRGDNLSGVKPYIEKGLDDLERTLSQQVSALFSSYHPDLRYLLDFMRTEAIAMLKEWCAEISNLFRHMLYLCFGEKRYTESEEKEVWAYALVFMEVYFAELYKHRSKARQIGSYECNLMANGIAMWAVIQSHNEHRVFRANRYWEDPRIFPKLQEHITKSYVRKNEIAGFTTLVSTLRDDVRDLQADQRDIRDVLIRLEAKLGRVQQQCGGGGDDGDAGAGAAKVGKNGKKRKEKRAQDGTLE